jgi:Arc/MetJ-type ribon-helix-helix transcriptional regulator
MSVNVPIRITPALRRYLDDLIEAGFGTQSEIIRIAIDRMHLDEVRAPTYKALNVSTKRND